MSFKFLDIVANILYPKRCFFCQEVMDYNHEGLLCDNCIKNIKYVGEIKESQMVCSNDDKIYFDKCYCVFEYEFVKKAIELFKFKSFKSYCNPIGNFMYEYGVNNNIFENIDIITAVPIHKSRLRERGFNHAEEMARVLSEKTNIPIANDIIKRIKKTKPMYKLDIAHRKENINNAFSASGSEDIIKGKTILLIDDIFTTGRTVNECANVLKSSGAGKVYVFCFSYS